ncbi:hypothetical protein [Ureibacillus sp. FSL E2-3493]|uniref:hypothetical protein n=1 Tax=Ureibacillus sp. FSL E2-3493 TaxID=2921367 RepID=UPI003119F101
MSVSKGFLKKIQSWAVDKKSDSIAFLPFQGDGNPYKSKVFLVGAKPELHFHLDAGDIEIYADSLVDSKLFHDVFHDEMSREYKGSINFAKWVEEHLNASVTLSSVNCFISDPDNLKQLKKSKHPLYIQGFEVFQQVLNEFEPNILVLQGASAYKLFFEQFQHQLVELREQDINETVANLERKGVIAKLQLNNGGIVDVLVCRSMGYFGKEGNSFRQIKSTLTQLLH